MDTRLQNQAKSPSVSSVAPVQTGLFQQRPFNEVAEETTEALHSSHQQPDLQTQLDRAARFGHNFSRVQVKADPPPVIQPQPLIVGQQEQEDEQEGYLVTEPVKMMAPPLGTPIQREDLQGEPIQRMPQLGLLNPVIQREDLQEEPIQRMPQLGLLNPVIQREDLQEEPIQKMPQLGLLNPVIQREDLQDEPIQRMPQWGVIQRQEAEAQEELIPSKLVQPKLVVGQPGDKYEQEADSMAAQVMSMSAPSANSGLVQRQGEEEHNEPLVQKSPLADSITPLVQRLPEEKEEAIQAKSLVQRAAKGNSEAGSNVESQLTSSKGGGSPLPDGVRSFMEPRFGVDFGSVRVHTDSTAVQMNKELGAQAFAHGSDIYYGSGKSPAQDSLTAHELTHVVQQTGAKKLQQKPLVSRQSNKETLQAKISPAPDTAIQCKQAPASPHSDPAFQAVVNKTKGVAQGQKTHPPAKTKATEAQAAAKAPANEVDSKAQDKQVQEMNQQKPGQFNAAAFKAALNQKIAAVAPRTLEEADNFKDSNVIGSVMREVTSRVTEQKKQASGPIEEKTKQPPNTSGITPKPVTPLPPKQATPKPGDVGAAGAAPKPKDASEVSLQAGSKQLDQQMTSAHVTEQQLAKSNEPEFKSALAAKKTAQADAAKSPAAYRQQEQGILTKAQAQAQTTASTHLQGMHGSKEQAVAKVLGNQTEAKGQDEQKRTEVANHIQGIYNNTKQKVEASLSQLDSQVNSQFDSGAAAAKSLFENYVDQRMKRYKDERYSGVGAVRWVTDKMFGMPSEVNAFYQEGRTQYLASMDRTIDQIANLVASKLNAAKQEIAKGKQEIQKYVAGLEPSLRQVGQKAAQNIQGKFDELEQSVDNKQDDLIDSLALKYNDNIKALDARIDEMKAENRGLVEKAKEAIVDTIKTINELKNMLMGVLQRAAGAIGKIIQDPIGFLGHLIAGLKQGFLNFKDNISQHLKKGFMGFLTGTMASAGIQMPKSFDMKGIFGLVTQVLGMTYDTIRPKAVKRMGEKKVGALESNFEMFVILKNEGTGGLWKFIQGQIGDLKSMVIDTLQNFIIEKVIVSGITWILSLLNPASAFVRACKAIIDIIMFFIERASQIAELINAIIEAVTAIASGSIGGAAKAIENALSKSLPVVISFMASLLGIGGISDKVQEVIKRVRQPIEKAINWVIEQAVKFAKKIGFGKNEKGREGNEKDTENSQDVKAKVRQELASQLPKEIKSASEIRPIINSVYNKYHPQGLKSLDVVEIPSKPGIFEIKAKASPEDSVGETTANLTLDLSDIKSIPFGTVTLLATVNGKPVGDGKFKNSLNKHAEERLIPILKDRWEDLAYQDREKTNVITIKITSSPCGEAEGDKFHNCADSLSTVVEELRSQGYKVQLQIESLGVYRGRYCPSSVDALKLLREKGVTLKTLSIVEVVEEAIGEELPENIRKRIESKARNMELVLDEIDKIGKGK